jgi:hypothetical protein
MQTLPPFRTAETTDDSFEERRLLSYRGVDEIEARAGEERAKDGRRRSRDVDGRGGRGDNFDDLKAGEGQGRERSSKRAEETHGGYESG